MRWEIDCVNLPPSEMELDFWRIRLAWQPRFRGCSPLAVVYLRVDWADEWRPARWGLARVWVYQSPDGTISAYWPRGLHPVETAVLLRAVIG
jgi:hypothetical protein